MTMSSSRDVSNGEHHRRSDSRNSQNATFDHDSSTAMSLDESSIQLNATSAAMTPLSVDVTGSSSFARGGAVGVGRGGCGVGVGVEGGCGVGGNVFGGIGGTNFSPLAASESRMSESTAMSISGMDMTPSSHAPRGGGRSNPRGIESGGDVLGNGGKGKEGGDNDGTGSKNSLSTNGGDGAAAANHYIGVKKPLNLNLSRLNSYNDSTIATENSKKNPQQVPSSASGQSVDWNADWDLETARSQLRRASRECRRRGLKLASRWASEQLTGLAPPPPNSNQQQQQSQMACPEEALLPEECCQPNDAELYALSLFDVGEYGRASHVLSGAAVAPDGQNTAAFPLSDRLDPPLPNLTPLGHYIRAFSLYLEGERRKEERATELRDPLERTSLKNANLPRLEAELRRARGRGELDAFGLYVYGVVLKGLRGTKPAPSRLPPRLESDRGVPKGETTGGRGEEGGHAAHRILIESIILFPFNWSAWLDLGELCVDDPSIDREVEEALSTVSEHWMYHFFCVHVFVENKANENAIGIIEKLANGNAPDDDGYEVEGGDGMGAGNESGTGASGFFVQSAYLQSQLAMAYYDVRDYDSAHEHFLALSEREPHRLDHMDAFSNVLYVKDQKAALSHLAHRSMAVDKYRPETCVVVGNYYSSRGRHEKAVQYFQRALKLDRTYLSAWTLLGHEYIEMKNTAAAIEAYRRAVDLSDREYRAWYGLGQTYEIMNMLLHALFYFRKAAALHPHDARMWCAIGGCLLGLDRRADAERSYERAVSLGDGEGIATRKLAELYREDGDEERAAKCYLRHLELRYQSQLPGSTFSGPGADAKPEAFEAVVTQVRVDEPEAEALLYLAYYYRDNLEYDQAILCATRLEDYPGPEKEQGKGLLRDIRSRMDQKAGDRNHHHHQGRLMSSGSPMTPAMGPRSRRDLSIDSKSVANDESSFEFSP